MHSWTISTSLTIIFVFLLFQISPAGQKLHYNFNNGKIYKYSTVVDSKTTGKSMGQPFAMSSRADFDYDINLISANDVLMTLMIKFEKISIELNMPMMGMYDSTIVMQEYLGKRIKMIMSGKGKIISVEPIDAIPTSRIQMMAGLTPTDLFRQLFLELPEKELDVHDSWKKDVPDTVTRIGMTMVVKQNLEFKIIAAEKKENFNCWKIASTGTNTIEGNGTQGKTEVTIHGTAKIAGTTYIAPAEGVFVLTEQSNETEMKTTAIGLQTGAATMSIHTTIKNGIGKIIYIPLYFQASGNCSFRWEWGMYGSYSWSMVPDFE